MAAELAARGLARGDRLCLHLANGIAYIDLYLACVRLGVVLVPMNILYRERELRHIVGDSAPKAIVAAANTDAAYPADVPVWSAEDLLSSMQSHDGTRVSVAGIDGDDAALIIYTSGTTGTAKGAVLSHNNLGANGTNLVSCWNITESDRYLAVLPLFHVHGLGNGLHSWLISGCYMRLAERFDQREAATLFEEFQPAPESPLPAACRHPWYSAQAQDPKSNTRHTQTTRTQTPNALPSPKTTRGDYFDCSGFPLATAAGLFLPDRLRSSLA